jgi:hypothetical protein
MILHSMSITPSIVGFVSRHGLNDGNGVSLFFLGYVALMIFAYLAVGFILRPRKFRDFPIVGKHKDLYGGLIEGTRKAKISNFLCPGSESTWTDIRIVSQLSFRDPDVSTDGYPSRAND